MKTRPLICSLLIAGLLVFTSACSVVRPATPTEAGYAENYMLAVENKAFGRAAHVIWVNPPRSKDLKPKASKHKD